MKVPVYFSAIYNVLRTTPVSTWKFRNFLRKVTTIFFSSLDWFYFFPSKIYSFISNRTTERGIFFFETYLTSYSKKEKKLFAISNECFIKNGKNSLLAIVLQLYVRELKLKCTRFCSIRRFVSKRNPIINYASNITSLLFVLFEVARNVFKEKLFFFETNDSSPQYFCYSFTNVKLNTCNVCNCGKQ